MLVYCPPALISCSMIRWIDTHVDAGRFDRPSVPCAIQVLAGAGPAVAAVPLVYHSDRTHAGLSTTMLCLCYAGAGWRGARSGRRTLSYSIGAHAGLLVLLVLLVQSVHMLV